MHFCFDFDFTGRAHIFVQKKKILKTYSEQVFWGSKSKESPASNVEDDFFIFEVG